MDQRSLLSAFHSNEQDLAANRAGMMGPGQVKQLLRAGNLNLLAGILASALLFSIWWLSASRPLQVVQWCLGVLLLLVPAVAGFVYRNRTQISARAGMVECYTGPIRKALRGRAGWYLYVGEESFALPVRPRHIENGPVCRVYVAPKARRIIAIELA